MVRIRVDPNIVSAYGHGQGKTFTHGGAGGQVPMRGTNAVGGQIEKRGAGGHAPMAGTPGTGTQNATHGGMGGQISNLGAGGHAPRGGQGSCMSTTVGQAHGLVGAGGGSLAAGAWPRAGPLRAVRRSTEYMGSPPKGGMF